MIARFYESFGSADIEAVLPVFCEQRETTSAGMGTVHGPRPFWAYLGTFKRAMPDTQVEIERLHDAGDTRIVGGRLVGRHTALQRPDGGHLGFLTQLGLMSG